jgi:hypothetical protein
MTAGNIQRGCARSCGLHCVYCASCSAAVMHATSLVFVPLNVRSTAIQHPRESTQLLLVHITKKGTVCELSPHILA